MSSGPPPIPLKYKMSTPQEPAQPKRVALPPPKKARVTHWEALFRIVIVLVIVGSAAVAYWSFFHRLTPLQKQSRSMLTTVSEMSSRLDQMERRWKPEEVSQIRARYPEVYTQLFADGTALQEWLGRIQAQAKPLALDLNVGFGQATAQEGFTNNLAIIPASIALEVLPALDTAEGKSPFERVLRFGQQLASYGKRADLAELNVSGGVDSVNRALLVFNLWAGDLGAEGTNAAPTAIFTPTGK